MSVQAPQCKATDSTAFTRSTDRYLRFGFFYPHSIGGEGTLSMATSMNLGSIEQHRSLARTVEEAGFDYMFMADKWDDRILDSPLKAEQVTWLFAMPMSSCRPRSNAFQKHSLMRGQISNTNGRRARTLLPRTCAWRCAATGRCVTRSV